MVMKQLAAWKIKRQANGFISRNFCRLCQFRWLRKLKPISEAAQAICSNQSESEDRQRSGFHLKQTVRNLFTDSQFFTLKSTKNCIKAEYILISETLVLTTIVMFKIEIIHWIENFSVFFTSLEFSFERSPRTDGPLQFRSVYSFPLGDVGLLSRINTTHREVTAKLLNNKPHSSKVTLWLIT